MRPSAERRAATVRGRARLLASVCLLAAPCSFVSVAQFGVGVGDTIVALALLTSIGVEPPDAGRRRRWAMGLALAAVALLAKESGLLVVAYLAMRGARRRDVALVAGVTALAAAYVIIRLRFVGHHSYVVASGLGFQMHTAAQLRARFGSWPYPFYAYNALSNLGALLFYMPVKGQLRLSPLIGLLSVASTLTTLVVGRYLVRARALGRHAALIALVPIGAMLGYAYSRPRIMFVGAFVMALLLGAAAEDLRARQRRPRAMSVLLTLWIVVLASTIARLWLMEPTA